MYEKKKKKNHRAEEDQAGEEEEDWREWIVQLIFFPRDLRNITKTYNQFGIIHKRRGNYEIAMECYVKALNIQLNSFPNDDPDVTRTYWNMGNLLVSVAMNKMQTYTGWQH